MASKSYDLLVLGSGPAGEKGAAQAAYFGKNVALIEEVSFFANETFYFAEQFNKQTKRIIQ